jgi:uncharacterized protein (DUF3084 family)
LKEVTDQKEKLYEEKTKLETLSSELQTKLTQKEEELKSTAQKLEKEKVSHVYVLCIRMNMIHTSQIFIFPHFWG